MSDPTIEVPNQHKRTRKEPAARIDITEPLDRQPAYRDERDSCGATAKTLGAASINSSLFMGTLRRVF